VTEEMEVEPTPVKPRWVGPPAPIEEGRQLRYLVHFAYMEDAVARGRALSLFDLSARRRLDEYAVTAEGTVRFQKELSSSDGVDSLDLRTARIGYVADWTQVNVGRFDLFPLVTPHGYFGALPTMGVRRVDGILVVSSLFFRLGMEEDKQAMASPFALALFYTPSLLSASWADLDQTQGYFLGQARLRLGLGGSQTTFRANFAKAKSAFFEYSPLSGQPA
jgi:hypothetical protein